MRNTFVHGVGGVLSADIAVSDHACELEFYTNILTTGDAPLWRDDLTNNLGSPVIGLGVRTPEYENLPQQWMPHFQVSDVATSAACAVEMGGKEIMHGKSEDGQSQWAVLADQFGAAFGVIPVVPGESDSAGKGKRLGCISWLSLVVPDALLSRDFYQQVVGWNSKPLETTEPEGHVQNYEMLIDKEISVAEICQYRPEYIGIPSVWLIHLLVDDLAESLRRVIDRGGEVIKKYSDEKHAVVRDPIGVCLALQAE